MQPLPLSSDLPANGAPTLAPAARSALPGFLGSLAERLSRRAASADPAADSGLTNTRPDVNFDGATPKPGTDASVGAAEIPKALLGLRLSVQKDAREILYDHVGGDLGDGKLHRDVTRVLRRLLAAAGLPSEAAQVFIGSSFLPQAFTTVVPTEIKAFGEAAGNTRTFRISNVFISRGLLRSVRSEAELAVILAHELAHNTKGHLKDFQGSHMTLGHFHEYEADAVGLKWAAQAGYDPDQAIDCLASLRTEYTRLKSEYKLLGRKKKADLELIDRIMDVHPDDNIRRAKLLDHLNEAREAFKRALKSPRFQKRPEPRPLWKKRVEDSPKPTRFERFEARLLRSEGLASLPEKLRGLESSLERESAKTLRIDIGQRSAAKNDDEPKRGGLGLEHYAMLEESFRRLLAGARSLDELHSIGVSLDRNRRSGIFNFPSEALQREVVARHVQVIIDDMRAARPGAPLDLEEFRKRAVGQSAQVRRNGTVRILRTVRTRAQLDAACRAISDHSDGLGLPMKAENSEDKRFMAAVARLLWRGTRVVQSEETGRPSPPETIIDNLMARLSPSWLRVYRVGFLTEILESAFGPVPYRSRQYRPSRLAAKLESRSDDGWRPADPDADIRQDYADALNDWSQRHHNPVMVGINEKIEFAYRAERFDLRGLSAPDPEDALDILWSFGVA
ncbi:MAG: M48 family metalloprotease, partial [Elusimicrobia bacterium]|nr:M48 family metalloprotease [Elusimicrobiota bacterium]